MKMRRNSRSRRRWMQVSLRAVCLLVLLFALAAAWLAQQIRQAKQDERIVQELAAAHGQNLNVLCNNPFDASIEGMPNSLLPQDSTWLTRLLGADIFRASTGLTCYAPGNSFSSAVDEQGRFYWRRQYVAGVTTTQLARIAQLRHLHYLSLEANPVDDRGIAHLVKLKRLDTLNLSHTAITDRGVARLAQSPQLRHLNLSYTDITDESLRSLATFPALETLNLEVTQLSADGIAWLAWQLPDCEIRH